MNVDKALQPPLGIALILFGLWVGRYAIKNREQGNMNTYIFYRTIFGSIGLIFIGIMMLLQKW